MKRVRASESSHQVKELRIGVVCYGGLSLAIYMHGVTKEIQNLVLASRWLENGGTLRELEEEVRDGRVDASVVNYFKILSGRSGRDGVRTRIVVDSISGTSAGGINGVFLAKALSQGQAQRQLRDLWFEKADKWQLLGGRALGLFKLVWMIPSTLIGQARPPFRGNAMYDWLLDALNGMEPSAVESAETQKARIESQSLVPEGDALRLFVTTTDFHGFSRRLAIGDPAFGDEKDYQKVMAFSDDALQGKEQFGRVWNPLLAFAARSTSSFPGAFEPVRPKEIEARLAKRHVAEAGSTSDPGGFSNRLRTDLFAEYKENGADPFSTSFIDGGVLDNHPFGPVIADVSQRPPRREVSERVLLYLEPDPVPVRRNPDGTSKERFYGPIIKAMTKIPSFEPMAGDLWEVERHNRRAALLADIVEASREEIADSVQKDIERSSFGETASKINARSTSVRYQSAPAGYLRLRAHSVVEQMARGIWRLGAVDEDGTFASIAWTVMHEWAISKGWIGPGKGDGAVPELLEDLDVGFRVRRLQFVADEVQALYRRPSRSQGDQRDSVDRALATLAKRTLELRSLMQPRALPEELKLRILGLFEPGKLRKDLDSASSRVEFARCFIARNEAEIDAIVADLRMHVRERLEEMKRGLIVDFDEITRVWDDDDRDLVQRAYFGYLRWDQLLYPYQRVGLGGELRPIRVVRVSPNDSRALGGMTAEEKLGGAKLGHFGAFFSRKAREQDYLWGRLDAFERLARLAAGNAALSDPEVMEGLAAVLSEADAPGPGLRYARELANEIRAKEPSVVRGSGSHASSK